MWSKLVAWISKFTVPAWIKQLFRELWENVIFPALEDLGKEIVDWLIEQIINQSKLNISGSEKFKNVANAFKQKWPAKEISDRVLNAVINNLVADLTARNIIQ